MHHQPFIKLAGNSGRKIRYQLLNYQDDFTEEKPWYRLATFCLLMDLNVSNFRIQYDLTNSKAICTLLELLILLSILCVSPDTVWLLIIWPVVPLLPVTICLTTFFTRAELYSTAYSGIVLSVLPFSRKIKLLLNFCILLIFIKFYFYDIN